MAVQMDDKRWEQGSFFHWMGSMAPTVSANPWDAGGRFYGCGRYSIRGLVSMGQATRGWKRLCVPSYYCHEVLADHVATGIEVKGYADNPDYPTPVIGDLDLRGGDVLIRVNYFGLRDSLNIAGIDRNKVEVIDDHTHDPWADHAWNSDADWCLLAFRKTLPVPDGCVLWSPRGHALPPQPSVTPQHRGAVADGFAAMVVKSLYLRGDNVRKSMYFPMARQAEDLLAFGETSGMGEISLDLLRSMPIQKWRRIRRENYWRLFELLKNVDGFHVMTPADDSRSCPFAAILVFDSRKLREHVRKELISRRVYGAVLWSLEEPVVDGVGEEQLSFSRRMLCIHCDMRYTAEDLERVATLIKQAVEGYSRRGVSAGATLAKKIPLDEREEVPCSIPAGR